MNNLVYCFICGYNIAEDTDFFNNANNIRFYMCPCCLFHYGIDDGMYKLMEYRQSWISQGLLFGGELMRPNWNFKTAIKQLNNLSKCNFSIFSKANANWENFIKVQNADWISEFDKDYIKSNWFKYRQ